MNLIHEALKEGFRWGDQDEDRIPDDSQIRMMAANLSVSHPDFFKQLHEVRNYLSHQAMLKREAGRQGLHWSQSFPVGSPGYTAARSTSTALQHEALLLETFVSAINRVLL